MSLRNRRIDEAATRPDGTTVVVSIGVPDDPYISKREMETVDLELIVDGEVVAAVNTILDPDQESEARALALEGVRGLESGELEPTAGAVDHLANTLPPP